MSEHFWLGIDAGTTLVKAVAFRDDLTVIAEASRHVPVTTPQPGWVEQDGGQILAAVQGVVAEVVDSVTRMGGTVAGAGLSNQGETVIAWDRETGVPLAPAIVWQDRRTDTWCREHSAPEQLAWHWAKTGLAIDAYFSASKMHWLVEEVAAVERAASRGRLALTTTDTFILWHLTRGAVFTTDPATASRTALACLEGSTWDRDLCTFYGVEPRWLPPIQPNIGEFGLLKVGRTHVPLRSSCVDQQAALLGHGAVDPGDTKVTYGTGAFCLSQLGGVPRLAQGRLLTTVAWDLGQGRRYAFDGGVLTAGAAVEWAIRLGLASDPSRTEALARDSRDLEVLFVPALQGLGAPYFDGGTRAALLGMSLNSKPADVVRAVLDGIAYRVADIVRAMNDVGVVVSRLRVDGGPTANSYLMQRQADLTGHPVEVVDVQDAAARGVAAMARYVEQQAWPSAPEASRVYWPKLDDAARRRAWERWDHAVALARRFPPTGGV